MFLSRWAVHRPIAMTAFIIVLIVLGINAYRKLNIDLLPSVDVPFILIRCTYQGGSPEEIEVEVARRIEDAVSSIEGIKHLSSMCMENEARISLEFNMGVDVDIAATDVREKLNRIRDDFPDGVDEPTIRKIDNNATTCVSLFLVGDRRVDELYDYADNVLSDRFSAVSGVGEVRVFGADEMQVHILVNRAKLTAANLTLDEVMNKLKANNVKVPAGHIKVGSNETNVTFDGEFKDFESMKNLEIGKVRGKRVYLRDVADVKLISKEMRSRTFVIDKVKGKDGKEEIKILPAVAFNIVKKGESNIVGVIDGVRKKYDEVNAKGQLPSGMKLVWFHDAGEFIHVCVEDSWSSILMGILLTAALLFLFLHDLRTTFTVIVSMPISVIVTFWTMQMMDYTFNVMTLLSLGCSVGVLVTNSIVVLENIFNRINRGDKLKDAAEQGTGEVIVAVAASALTNVVVFVPVAMMKTRTGLMMAPFAGVMVVATLVSLFISFTLTPILAFVLLKEKGAAPSRFQLFLQRIFVPWDKGYDALCRWFNSSIIWTRHHAWSVIIVSLVSCVLVWLFVVPAVGLSFMPDADQAEMTIRFEFPTNYNIDTTTKLTLEAAERIKHHKFIRGMAVNIGNVSGSGGQVSSAVYLSQIRLRCTQKYERKETITELLDIIRNDLGYMRNCIVTLNVPKGGGGSAADIPARVSGASIQELERLGRKAQEEVRGLGITKDLDTSIRTGKPNINVSPRRPILQNMNISAKTLSNSVRSAYEGIECGTFRVGSRSFDIRVQMEKESGLEQIRKLAVNTTKNGNPMSLEVLADIKSDVRPICINRYDKERAIWLYANGAPGIALGTVAAKLRTAIENILPPGYGLRMVGAIERMNETFLEFLEVIVLAVILVYLLIAAILESWTRPFLILFTIPLGFLGMYITLFLAGMPMSMMGLLGGVMMIGIVVNNAILIMDECATLSKTGLSPHDAMMQATENKFRPIVMTSIASVIGMIPMAVGNGLGSELRASCGLGVVGGLTLAAVMTLYVIPALYFAFVPDKKAKKEDESSAA